MQRKRCTRCRKIRSVKQFYVKRNGRLVSQCKLCSNAICRDYYRRNRQRSIERSVAWHKAHPDRKRQNSRRSRLKTRYDLSEHQLNTLKRAQRFRCALCCKRRPLLIDHCHKTHKVRMLLCSQCNSGIGMLNDDPKLLMRAALLVRNPPAQAVLHPL